MITLVSGHVKNWNAGASKVYLHLDRHLRGTSRSVTLINRDDLPYRSLSGFFGRCKLPYDIRRAATRWPSHADVIDVAGNIGFRLFKQLHELPVERRPLLVSRLHGLEFLDEQARIDEEIRVGARLSSQYKLISRHVTNAYERRTLAAADVIVCHTSRDADAVIARGWAPTEKICVIPLGVDQRFDLPNRTYRSDARKVLWWGSWVERKGVHYIGRTFELAVMRLPDLRLTIGGSGRSAAEVLSYFPSGVRDLVHVLPFVDELEHIRQLENHDIFLFPSLSEGFGLALLEAMRAGLPCVTTPTGMGYDHLEHGMNCMMVPQAAPTATANAIARLCTDQDLRRRIGRRAAADASNLTWERYGRESATLYDERLRQLRSSGLGI